MNISQAKVICALGLLVLAISLIVWLARPEPFSVFVQTPGQVKSERFGKSARDNIYVKVSNDAVSDYTKNVDKEYAKGSFSSPYNPSAPPSGGPGDRTAMDAMRLSEIDNDLDLNVARVNRQNNLGQTGITAY